MEIVIALATIIALYIWFKSKKPEPSNKQRYYPSSNTNRAKGRVAKVNPLNGFVVVDVETTGLHANRNKIIELAAIKILDLNAKNHDTLEYLVKIKGKIPAKIVEITGITDEMLTDGVDIETAINELKNFCGDLPIVAYNAEFDKGFLLSAASKVPFNFDNEFHCALLMARKAFPNHDSYKLSALANYAGIDTKGAHRAMQDCVMTAQVYSAALKKLGKAIAV